MSLLRIAAALAVLGVVACNPERDATSSVPLPVLTNPLGVAPGVSVAEPHQAAQPKEDGGKRSD